MEIKIAFKTPMADVNVEFKCSEAETQMFIADPVYQRLGEGVIEQIRRYAQDEGGHWRDMRSHKQQQSDRFEHMRRAMEADRKAQQSHNETVDTAIKSLQDQMNRMFKVINNSSITKF